MDKITSALCLFFCIAETVEEILPEISAKECHDYDVPKVWAKFKFDKKDILHAMSTTPGWIE